MSVREEDSHNKNCPSRGLGIAAAAIGVGVGAALYYFFSKRPENPDEAGSTSTWECEQAQAFTEDDEFEDTREESSSDDSYTTLSEHSTTDTSIHSSPLNEDRICNNCGGFQYNSDDETLSSDSLMSVDTSLRFESDTSMTSDIEVDGNNSESEETGILNDNSDDSDDVEINDDNNDQWDIIHYALDVPTFVLQNNLFNITNFGGLNILMNGRGGLTEEEQMERARALSEEEQLKYLKDQAFRERSWSLEECSICFDVILKNQEVMSLPCTHHFHTACILPWLQEKQTCPNCRTAAE